MEQLAIMIMVDCAAALQDDSLSGNIYLVDNNKSGGSVGQGTQDLVTAVEGMQILNWLPVGINLTQFSPAIAGISGQAVDEQVMVAQQFFSPEASGGNGAWWGAMVGSSTPVIVSYTLEINIWEFTPTGVTFRKQLSFDSKVNIKTGFSNVPQLAEAMAGWGDGVNPELPPL